METSNSASLQNFTTQEFALSELESSEGKESPGSSGNRPWVFSSWHGGTKIKLKGSKKHDLRKSTVGLLTESLL